MLSSLLHIVTSLAMLVHSVGGCCWHHQHGGCDQGSHCDQDAVVVDADHACPHSHAHPLVDGRSQLVSFAHALWMGECPGAPDEEPPRRTCGELTCVYLPAASPELTTSPGAAPEGATEGLIALCRDMVRVEARCDDSAAPPGSAIARCALVQVWRL